MQQRSDKCVNKMYSVEINKEENVNGSITRLQSLLPTTERQRLMMVLVFVSKRSHEPLD